MVNKKLLLALLLFISTVAIAQGFIPKLNVDNIQLDGNTISSTDTNGNLSIDLNGSGQLRLPDLTATTVPYLDSNKGFVSSLVTPTELDRLSGVSSALCGISQSCTLTNKVLSGNTATNLISASGTFTFNTTGTLTAPNATDTLVGRTTTDTLTNKTLTSPSITNPTIDAVSFDDQSTPSNPSSGFYKLYFKNDGQLYKLNSSGTEAQVGSGTGGGTGGINLLQSYNSDAELGATTNWTNSGGTFSTTTTAANVGFGNHSFSFDASAAGQYVESSSITIPSGLFGNPCYLHFYSKGFDSNMTYEVTTGSSTIASGTFSATDEFRSYESQVFSCPSSGTLSAKFRSTADAAIGYLDNVHLGSATNLTNISQASFVGSAYYVTTTNCTWQRTNTVIGAFGTDSDCPGPTVDENPGPGTIQTTDADLPRFTFNNLPPGEYLAIADTAVGCTGAAGCLAAMAITDGTTTIIGGGSNHTAGEIDATTVTARFKYTSAGNRSFEIYGSASANTLNLYNAASNFRTKFSLYRFPSTSDLAYKPSQMPFFWEGRHDGTCAWTRSNTAYGDPAGDASCTLAEFVNVNAGSVTSTANGALTLTPGISLVFPRTSRYEVCGEFRSGGDTVGATNAFQMLCGAITIAQRSNNEPSSGGLPLDLCGIYSPTTISSTPTDCKIQMAASSGTGAIQANSTYHYTIRWTVKDLLSPTPAPLLVNSVVSPYAGVLNICSAIVTFSGGAPSISSSLGNCGSSVTDHGNGDTSVTFAASTFSAAPYCISVGNSTIGSFVSSQTSSAVRVVTFATSSGTATDANFTVNCWGPK